MHKNCTSEDDLIKLCRECLTQLGKPVKLPHILNAKSSWTKIKEINIDYFSKHKYIPIFYDARSNTFKSEIRRPGRPHSQNPCDRKVTVRLRQGQISKLENYCLSNNISNYSKAIRKIIDLL